MLEGAWALAGLTAEPHFSRRADQLLECILGPLRDASHGCVIERCYEDWRYDRFSARDRVSSGHNLKTAGLLAAHSDERYISVACELLEFCLRHAWDEAHGGFFEQTFRNGRLATLQKQWWAQCEGIVALLDLIARGVEVERYSDYLRRLETFAFTHLVDEELGEWYAVCSADGAVTDSRKATFWKGPYHTVRMAILADASLRATQPPAAVDGHQSPLPGEG